MTISKSKINKVIQAASRKFSEGFTEGRVDRLGDLIFSTTYRLLPSLTNTLTRRITTTVIRRWQKVPADQRCLLFICNGNICRSAYAHWAAVEKGNCNNLLTSSSAFNSAGLFTDNGKSANPQAIASAAKRHIDLSKHQTRKFSSTRVDGSVLLLPMTLTQYLRIIAARPSLIRQTLCFGLFALNPNAKLSIADPYGGTDETFQECFNRIDLGLESLAQMLH